MHLGDKEALFEMQGHSTHADHAPSSFIEHGHEEEMVNGLDEGWMRVFQASWTLELLRA